MTIPACVECGNDDPTEGYPLCMDCLAADPAGGQELALTYMTAANPNALWCGPDRCRCHPTPTT